jgi:antitoxin YefM
MSIANPQVDRPAGLARPHRPIRWQDRGRWTAKPSAVVISPYFSLPGCYSGPGSGMQILPISKVKDRLNELVDAAANTLEQVTITKNGSPAAVLIGVDEWESIQESLFWLSQPGIRESIAEAEADVEGGRVYSEEQVRAQFNVPKSER